MQGNFFLGNGSFAVKELHLAPLSDGDVLIRNMAAGICGTDVHIWKGEKGSAEVAPPVVLGHEYSGIVEAIGPGVHTVKVGDHVTIDPNIYCGKCRFCRNGQKQFCENLTAIGVNRDGGFATHSIAPQAQVFPMNPAIGFEAMAMAEPLACCIHGIEQVEIRSGDVACIIGGGAIGLLMAQLAKVRGAALVVVSEPVAKRREIARSLGVDVVIDPMTGNLLDQLEAATGRRAVDVVIECAGNLRATEQAFAIADRGGRVLLFSVPAPDAKFPLPLMEVFNKELRIYGSFINPDSHLQAVAMLNSGRIQTAPLITHRFPLGDVEEAIKWQMGPDSIKVLVMPQE